MFNSTEPINFPINQIQKTVQDKFPGTLKDYLFKNYKVIDVFYSLYFYFFLDKLCNWINIITRFCCLRKLLFVSRVIFCIVLNSIVN